MAKRCPPGVICIENITIIFLILILCLAGFVWYKFGNSNTDTKENQHYINVLSPSIPKFNTIFSTNPGNVLMNPFAAPLKNGNFFPRDGGDPRGIPININTRGFDTNYRQVGILTRNVQVQGEEVILAVMGRPLYTNRSKWQYYTISDKNHVKLPIIYKNKSSMNEYGVDELFNGDTVYVQGYNDTFKITIYENNHNQYIPY